MAIATITESMLINTKDYIVKEKYTET